MRKRIRKLSQRFGRMFSRRKSVALQATSISLAAPELGRPRLTLIRTTISATTPTTAAATIAPADGKVRLFGLANIGYRYLVRDSRGRIADWTRHPPNAQLNAAD